jgi:hypothetical protein
MSRWSGRSAAAVAEHASIHSRTGYAITASIREPFPVDTNKTAQLPTPEGFRTALTTTTVTLLPLVDDHKKEWRDGWCTYSDHFEKNPDIEFISGGANDKAITAAAIWRQGNLLHFGFEQSPAELNETGRRLLLNSIAYISRFTEDRPIAVTPSVFSGPAGLPRSYLDRRVNGTNDIQQIDWMVSPDLARKIVGLPADERRKWYESHRSFLHPGKTPEKRLEIDEDALALNAPLDKSDFFTRCIAALDTDKSAAALKLLQAYAPLNAGELSTSAEWEKWFAENKKYLFFSDQADYRWYIDPLAKKRGVPSADLRGEARASRP